MGETGLRIVTVIPLYNGARFIARALDSVLDQTLPPSEIIVVDDGSTDDGPVIVQRFVNSHPIRLLRKPNGGQSSARNFGIASSNADHIALLDQDDAWYPNHLEELVRPFQEARARELGWVYSDLDEIDSDGNMVVRSLLRMMPSAHPKRDVFTCLTMDMFVLPSASLISRKAFEAVGGFDENLMGYEDDDLFLRLFRAGYDNIYLDIPLTQWRIHTGSSSYSRRMSESRAIYFRKLLASFPDEPQRRRYFARDCLAPRFFPKLASDYLVALRDRENDGVAVTFRNLKFVSRLHNPRVRIVMTMVLPFLRFPFVARCLVLPFLPVLRPIVRWALRVR
ncbi:MAG TPA: glycosyltransferase [Acetobacteraceae bacterium]|nr:glycosyltransferase [Acetobacteraceae bacterium]